MQLVLRFDHQNGKRLNLLENEFNQKFKIINEKLYSLNHNNDNRVTEINSLNSRLCTIETKINNDIKSLNGNLFQLNIQVESQKLIKYTHI